MESARGDARVRTRPGVAAAAVAGVVAALLLTAVGLAVSIYVTLSVRDERERKLRANVLFVHEEAEEKEEAGSGGGGAPGPTASVSLGGEAAGTELRIISQGRHDGEWVGEAAMPRELRRGLQSGVIPSHIWWGGAMVPLDAAAALRVRDAWQAAGRPGRKWWHLGVSRRGGRRVARLELRDEQLMVRARIASPFEVPDRLDPGDRIPRRITVFWAQGSPVPVRMARVWEAWRRQHRGYEFRVYDDAGARAMLARFFDHRVVAAFDALIPAAFRSDLFAACAVFVYGGFAIDAKVVPRPGASFEDDVPHDVDLYVSQGLPGLAGARDGFWKGVVGGKPGDPVMREVIDRVCDRVEANDVGAGPLYTTGGALYGRAFASVFGLRRRDLGAGVRRLVDREGVEHTVMVARPRALALPDYDGYHDDQLAVGAGPHYSKLWRARRVFRRGAPPLPSRGPAFPLKRFVRAVRRESRAERRRQRRVNKSMDI